MFNVFIDSSRGNVATFHVPRAYDASALANHYTDAGFFVETDLWGATVANAMMSPDIAELAEQTLPLVAA